jgi:hypothetical protein
MREFLICMLIRLESTIGIAGPEEIIHYRLTSQINFYMLSLRCIIEVVH